MSKSLYFHNAALYITQIFYNKVNIKIVPKQQLGHYGVAFEMEKVGEITSCFLILPVLSLWAKLLFP